MIPSNEVRVNNWYYDAGGYSRQMTAQTPIALCMQHWSPISLTPEILEKCGFVLHSRPNSIVPRIIHNKYTFEKLVLIPEGEYFDAELDCGYDADNASLTRITSVHQLQNLYFALSGEELTVNL